MENLVYVVQLQRYDGCDEGGVDMKNRGGRCCFLGFQKNKRAEDKRGIVFDESVLICRCFQTKQARGNVKNCGRELENFHVGKLNMA